MNYQKIIIDELKKHGAKGELNLKSEFSKLGIDSLDLMDMIVQLEEELDISVPDDDLLNLKTIDDLVKLVTELKK
jgi:acyl carrier protein